MGWAASTGLHAGGRWSGAATWTASPAAASALSARWAGDTLYLSDGQQIVAVGPQSTQSVVASDAYTLTPLGVGDGTLAVLALRSRGSARFELWALDAASGDRLWERVLQAHDPFEGGTDTGEFAAAVVGDALAVLEARRAGRAALRADRPARRPGRTQAALGVENPDDDIRGAVWGRERLGLAAGGLYTVDLKTGNLLARWP